MTVQDPVIIIGAGPTGLALAAALAQVGIATRIFEAEPALTRDMRAGSFHPPTLQMLDSIGVAKEFIGMGIAVPRWQIRDRHQGVIVEWNLNLLADETPYPYRLHCEQFNLTPILKRRYEALGGTVHFNHRLLTATQDADGVQVVLHTPEGELSVRGSYLIGADGARSTVRKSLNIAYEGFTWPERFLVIGTTRDLGEYGFTMNAYLADPDEFGAIFKMPHGGPRGLWRYLIPVSTELSEETVLAPEFAEKKLQALQPVPTGYDIEHVGIYNVHQRVAAEWRVGRVVLMGDAAHANNPLGAFGLNGGLHDAFNLADKLIRLIKGSVGADVLDHYVRQRRSACVDFVQAQSISNKRLLEEKDPSARARNYDELRAVAADPVRHKEFVMRSSMIASVRMAAQVA